ncbi:MAG: calcium/sodium antiporter [Nanoarchaeota archaeon]
MIIESIIFFVALVFLVMGSDYFVKSAALIAERFGVSEFVIGLTVVALGTSIPELASSIVAAIENETQIIIGNVVGSNIANIGLIVGVATVIRVMRTKREMVERDGHIMLFAGFLFLAFAINGVISKIEAGILLLFYLVYMAFLLEIKPEFKEQYNFRSFLRYFFRFKYLVTIKNKAFSIRDGRRKKNKEEVIRKFELGLLKDLFTLILGGAAVVLGAKYVVEEAIFFAEIFNVPSALIGITLIAVGTSLPELSVSIAAIRKGYANIAIGNIVGSNIANIFLIIGVSGLIVPLEVIKSILVYSMPIMIIMGIFLLIFIRSHWEIRRIEGIVFIGLYVLFIIFLFITQKMPFFN